MTDSQWWVTQEPFLNKVIDPARFPVGTRVGTSAGQEYQGASNPEHVFRFGLDRILDGIAELIPTKNNKQENKNGRHYDGWYLSAPLQHYTSTKPAPRGINFVNERRRRSNLQQAATNFHGEQTGCVSDVSCFVMR
jgi:hypothetical protein